MDKLAAFMSKLSPEEKKKFDATTKRIGIAEATKEYFDSSKSNAAKQVRGSWDKQKQAFEQGFYKRAAEYGISKEATLHEYLKSVEAIRRGSYKKVYPALINKNMTHDEVGLDDLDRIKADMHYEAGAHGRKLNKVDNDPRDTIEQHWHKLTKKAISEEAKEKARVSR